MIFVEKTHRLLAFAAPKDGTAQNFAEKTFTNSHKTVKFVKVFISRKFPLYGTQLFVLEHEASLGHLFCTSVCFDNVTWLVFSTYHFYKN